MYPELRKNCITSCRQVPLRHHNRASSRTRQLPTLVLGRVAPTSYHTPPHLLGAASTPGLRAVPPSPPHRRAREAKDSDNNAEAWHKHRPPCCITKSQKAILQLPDFWGIVFINQGVRTVQGNGNKNRSEKIKEKIKEWRQGKANIR